MDAFLLWRACLEREGGKEGEMHGQVSECIAHSNVNDPVLYFFVDRIPVFASSKNLSN